MDSQAPAAAANGQPHDAPDSPESLLIGAPIQNAPELVADANPINFIDENSPAFHIRHGQDDRLVAIGQSELLAEALAKQGIDFDFEKIPGADHGFDGMKESHLLVDVGLKYLDELFSRHA
jgi:dipeptidyl aminopeptidase/acylaminoacyl peptidase